MTSSLLKTSQCTALTARGVRCRATAYGGLFCALHDEARKAERHRKARLRRRAWNAGLGMCEAVEWTDELIEIAVRLRDHADRPLAHRLMTARILENAAAVHDVLLALSLGQREGLNTTDPTHANPLIIAGQARLVDCWPATDIGETWVYLRLTEDGLRVVEEGLLSPSPAFDPARAS